MKHQESSVWHSLMILFFIFMALSCLVAYFCFGYELVYSNQFGFRNEETKHEDCSCPKIQEINKTKTCPALVKNVYYYCNLIGTNETVFLNQTIITEQEVQIRGGTVVYAGTDCQCPYLNQICEGSDSTAFPPSLPNIYIDSQGVYREANCVEGI